MSTYKNISKIVAMRHQFWLCHIVLSNTQCKSNSLLMMMLNLSSTLQKIIVKVTINVGLNQLKLR